MSCSHCGTPLSEAAQYCWHCGQPQARSPQPAVRVPPPEDERRVLAAIWDLAADAMVLSDPQGVVLKVNRAYSALYGYPPEWLVGRSLAAIFPAAERARAETEYQAVFAAPHEPPAVETSLPAIDGRRRIVESRATFITQDGRRTALLSIVRDITERKQVEAALRRSEARFATAFQANPYMQIILRNRDTTILAANDRWAEMTGYPQEAVLGRRIVDLRILDDPDDMARLAREFRARGAVRDLEVGYRTRAGEQHWARVAVQPLDLDGTACALVIARDITHRKRDQTRARFLARVTSELAASLDWDATLATLTRLLVPAWADACTIDLLDAEGQVRRVAVAGGDALTQARLAELRARYPVDPGRAGSRQVIESGATLWWPDVPAAFLTAARDPGHRAILEALAPRSMAVVPFLARGRAIGTVALLFTGSGRRYEADDRPMLEELARRAGLALDNARLYREAQEAVATRDAFLSVASHELKTPLTVLLGSLQLLERRLGRAGTLSPDNARLLQIPIHQARRLDGLVSRLFDVSRMASGQLSIDRAPLDLGALAARVVAELAPTLERHTLALDVVAPGLWVLGDELRLEQVLQNLLQNAVKYSPAGGRVVVRVAPLDERVCVEVGDTGIGIPAAALPDLFERFYRAPNVAGGAIGGLGIGLYVTREIVALHGGEVAVQSTEGQGSTFTVCLRRYAPPEPAPA